MSKWKGLNRRTFVKGAAAASIATALGEFKMKRDGWLYDFTPNEALAQEGRKLVPSQCPYCGVGCATFWVVEEGKVVGCVPDKDSPVNMGMQCIKGLTAFEPLYVDRLDKVLVRKDMSDPLTGYVSKTKGSFKDSDFREVSWEEGSHIVRDKIVKLIKKFGGNSIGLWGSGQLTLEEQWVENQMMKGIFQSNSIEANARMCMTSAVTGYFATLGSDTPPQSYSELEKADFITHWGHNARGSHPVIFWRVAATKEKRNIPTMVVDPRFTGTMAGYDKINSSNSYSVTIRPNGDISLMNAIAYCLMKYHPDAIDHKFIKEATEGFDKFREVIMARYSPEQVVDRTGLAPAYVKSIAKTWAEATIKGRERGSGGVLSFWGIGWNQSIHGQNRTKTIVALHLLTGNIGKEGCGPFSMTGQPNAMGERLMGGLTSRLPFNEGLGNVQWRNHIAKHWGISNKRLAQTAKEKNPGTGIGMFERAKRGDIQAVFFKYATHIDPPETNTLIRPGITRTFTVSTEAYRHAPNLLYSDVVFPASTIGEKGGTYINSERRLYVTDKAVDGPANTRPDLDISIDEGKEFAKILGLDPDKMLPYKKKTSGPHKGFYDPEDVFRVIVKASKGSDSDLYGMLDVEKKDGIGLYEQLRQLKGMQWPAPNYEIAKKGGAPRRYMNQEGWDQKPYGLFRHKNGRAKFIPCEQDYSDAAEIYKETQKVGLDDEWYAQDHMDLLRKMRDRGLPPELPDFDYMDKSLDEQKEADKYPLWLSTGVVFEHFHTAKTIRGATTRKLVPEQYVEMNDEDARRWGVKDGEWVKVVTPRGEYQGKASVGGPKSKVKPARNIVFSGQIFSPWNLNVADSADPKKNKWNVNAATVRLMDPVSGQVDFKHCKGRIEKLS
jgi:anaerobic selenocysteine-containing dehydrogenase